MNGKIDLGINSINSIKDYEYIPTSDGVRFTSIIILSYNQLECTKLCIESIRKFTPKGYYEIIVIDNNSNEETKEWLKEQEDLITIFNDSNLGFPAACNQGIEVSIGESLLLLNNDTIVTPDWLNNLSKSLYSSSNIGVVSPVTNSCSNGQQIGVAYDNIEEMLDFAIGFNYSNPDLWNYRSRLVGYCYLIKREVVNKIGGLDEIFTPGNFEDDDWSFRTLREGYFLLMCRDTFIHHFGSVSFKNEGSKYYNHLMVNKGKFGEKWGFSSDYGNNRRYDVIDVMDKDTKNKINVLEIGCGMGATLYEIKNKFKNVEIFGIEENKSAAEVASGVFNIITGNVENLELSYKRNYFDYIILVDIIEHIKDPWDILSKLSKYLNDDGEIIAIIPNIMHISVITELINGKFTYKDGGILDKNHLRFFTLAEICKMFSMSSLSVISIKEKKTNLSEKEKDLIDILCKESSEMQRQQYAISEYIVKAKKSSIRSKLTEGEVRTLKYRLMRIDNDLDIERSLNWIFNLYYKDNNDFTRRLVQIIENNIINKDKVLDILEKEALKRGIENKINIRSL